MTTTVPRPFMLAAPDAGPDAEGAGAGRPGALRALVIRTAGTNCDGELAHAFRLAGATPEFVHLRTLIDQPDQIDRYHLIGVPGGFSYGDDIAAGRVFATYLRERLYPIFRRAVVERQAPIIAPCNGFQVLVKARFLPGFDFDDSDHPAAGPGEAEQGWPSDAPPRQACTLAANIGGAFIDRWLPIEIDEGSPCIWTRGLGADSEPAGVAPVLPIAHGEGRFVADPAVLDVLEQRRLIPVRYGAEVNVNGSERAIAGICDPTGLVFGLMPHPERYTSWLHHPQRTRLDPATLKGREPLGLRMFRAAVEFAREHTSVLAGDAVSVSR